MESYVQQVASEPNSYSRTNRLQRNVNSKIYLNNSSLLNTPPPFNGAKFEIWKARLRIFIQMISFELWKTIINYLFIPNHQIDGEELDKPDYLQIIEEKIKFEIDFKAKNFLVMTLDDSKLCYTHRCKTSKEIWDTLEMIYVVLPSNKQEEMNIRVEEDGDIIYQCF